MTIANNITTELSSLQAQVAAAAPLANAPHSTITAIQLNAANLISDIQAALAAANQLDNYVPPVDPLSMIPQIEAIVQLGTDQSNLSLMRGLVGRATSNLDQI